MSENSNGTHSAQDILWIKDAPQSAGNGASEAPQQDEFTIGELAREFGVTLRALRFYENKGFIAPRRNKNTRLYSQQDRARIAAILSGKRLGFTLAEIRTMIGARDGNRDAENLRISKERCLEQI